MKFDQTVHNIITTHCNPRSDAAAQHAKQCSIEYHATLRNIDALEVKELWESALLPGQTDWGAEINMVANVLCQSIQEANELGQWDLQRAYHMISMRHYDDFAVTGGAGNEQDMLVVGLVTLELMILMEEIWVAAIANEKKLRRSTVRSTIPWKQVDIPNYMCWAILSIDLPEGFLQGVLARLYFALRSKMPL